MTRAFPVRLIGHRGASAEYPENTLESFGRAMELGVDVLETDVHMTADGHVVVSHDEPGERAANVPAAIAETNLAEVQSWDAGWAFVDDNGQRPFAGKGMHIPTLHQLLDAAGDTLLNLDIKQRKPAMVAPLMKLLRDRGAEDRVTLASFHAELLRQVRQAGYRGPTALSLTQVLGLRTLPRFLLGGMVQGCQAVQIPPRHSIVELSSCAFITKCHDLGLRVDYWTINDAVEADVLLERGADGIMTDDPRLLLDVVQRHKLLA